VHRRTSRRGASFRLRRSPRTWACIRAKPYPRTPDSRTQDPNSGLWRSIECNSQHFVLQLKRQLNCQAKCIYIYIYISSTKYSKLLPQALHISIKKVWITLVIRRARTCYPLWDWLPMGICYINEYIKYQFTICSVN